jgi:rhomboid protease GluP
MLKRQTSGSCICVFCNQIISVDKSICPHCERKNPSLWGYSRSLRRLGSDLGFIQIVTWGCISLYLITLLIDYRNITIANTGTGIGFDLLSPSIFSLVIFGASGAYPVFGLGRWWTFLSAGWLHGSLLHIAFNLLWIRSLASEVAQAFGVGRLVIIYTFAIFMGCVLSSVTGYLFPGLPGLQGAQITIGASGGLFGLLGALLAYGQITKDYQVRYRALVFALLMFLLGVISPNVDNWGHFGGFLGGYLISNIPGLNPRYREGLRHLFVALICLGLTGLSILASVIHGIYIISVSNT